MARPCKKRIINSRPVSKLFEPSDINSKKVEKISLNMDEFEALKLANIEDLNMIQGAKKMGVSASTFNRTLMSASKKIADAIVNGKSIVINDL